MPSIDLAIIIVNWNVSDLLRACLESIYHAPGAQLEADGTLRLGNYLCHVFVVDNASTDNSPQMVREQFPRVQLIANQQNLGFTAGNNVALRRCQSRYVLLLNPDTRIVGNALTVMLDYIESHGAVGVVGPQLRYGDGSLQSSRRRFPTLMTAFMESTLLQQWFPHNRWARRYYMAETPDDRTQEADWVNGACMLVRSEAIQRVGLLDEGFFMYSEELDWCRRMVADGWKVVYLPHAMVIHYEGQSSGQVVAARHIHFERSKIRYFRKHHGEVQAGLLRLFLLSTYLYRLMEEGAKYLLGHKRELRRARLSAYAQVVRSGLRPAHG